MTAAEKTSLARFLDAAGASARGGYGPKPPTYDFTDDAEISAEIPVELPTAEPAEDDLESIARELETCAACRLAQGRKRAVPGEGAESPLVLVIGEGPGAEEDASGRPFVGPAGRLLDKMLAAIGLSREENCFIANIVKCRPPGNRDPMDDETAACLPFLHRQIALLRPAFILCMGRIAAGIVLRSGESLGRLRGRITELDIAGLRIPALATYHPSAILRNDEYRRPAWEDLKLLKSALDSGCPLDSEKEA